MNDRRQLLSGMLREPLKADGHLSDDWLMLAIDGELSAPDHARVKEHVRACWTCRARKEQLETTIKEIVEYEHALVAPDMPPSPGAKAIFMAHLSRLSGELGSQSIVWRYAGSILQFGRSKLALRTIWATSAPITIALVLYICFGRHTPVVSASQLLQRAAASEAGFVSNISQPVAIQKVSIAVGNRKIVGTLYRDTVHKRRTYRTDANANEVRELKPYLARSLFRWDEPLSPETFDQWRSGVSEKKDVVTELSGGLLRLDTSSGSGPVAEASLTVRADNYHAIAEDLRLRDNTQIEIAELSFDVVELSTLPLDIFGSLAPPATSTYPSVSLPSSLHPVRTDAPLAAAYELQVRTALHGIGADLGEQITIQPTADGFIQVDGIAENEERKGQINNALQGVAHTKVQVITVAQAAAHPTSSQPLGSPRSTTVITATPPLLEEQLERRFPDSDQRAEYVNQSLSLCQSASARAWALNRLADRYTPRQIALLDPDGQRQLQSLLADHISALREDLGRLQNQLGQVLSSASNTAAANTPTSATTKDQSDDWRNRAHRVHSSVEITNESVSVLLTGSSENSDSSDKLQLRLRTTLTQLQAELQVLDQHVHKQL